jgi:hypothetical protein
MNVWGKMNKVTYDTGAQLFARCRPVRLPAHQLWAVKDSDSPPSPISGLEEPKSLMLITNLCLSPFISGEYV